MPRGGIRSGGRLFPSSTYCRVGAGSSDVFAEPGGVVMSWDYQYTPYIWPMLASAAFLWLLAAYTWRHRAAPGAVALSSGMSLMGLWALSAAFGASSADLSTELFWFRVKNVVSQPAPLAGLCFALGYAGLGGWITRRRLAILLAPSVAIVPLMFYDDSRILWTRYWMEATVHRTLAPVGVGMNVYGLGLLLIATAVIASLFVRSPLHRVATSLIILGHLGMLVVIPLEALNVVPDTPLDLSVLSADFAFTMYAVALYRFGLFDVVPVARATVFERMVDGVVVLDARSRVADLNPAAQALLGAGRSRVLGRDAADALESFPAVAELARDPQPRQIEIPIGTPPAQRWHEVSSAPLTDDRGFRLGSVIVLHDITTLRQAHERLVQQERALAALREREQLARELHDSVGQVFAYVSLQVDAALKLLDDGKTSLATAQLGRLGSIARDAHADVREFILDLRMAPTEHRAFLPALRRYLEGFAQNYGIATTLLPPDGLPAGLDDAALEPEAQAQLFRIVQEALSNARKHGGARAVTVSFDRQDGQALVSVQDDGHGFDPSAVEGGFGLRFMRERAAEMGGCVEVQSEPGRGTRVVVAVPLRQREA